ncbi:MAG: L,D-transpeptidase family protein [Bradyrhizobium sp.]|nr:L,D-transpeptidase family protein [Bradyrhizobium sp.]MDX3968988.1 L,D-transpeptidase family protein [Bradyrhizobium sp.]
MTMRSMLGAVISLWLIGPALAGHLDPAAVNDAARPAKQPATDKLNPAVVKLQVLLDRAQFSPGEIDGKLGENAQKALRAFAEQNYPASVGSPDRPTPSGTLKVTGTHESPTYRYNPDYKFKSVRSKRPFDIKPGPNNPVGAYWIGLSAQGYGIHGTAAPDKVSKSASHGCVRLTNWDARVIGENVKRGTPVVFLDASTDTSSEQQGGNAAKRAAN